MTRSCTRVAFLLLVVCAASFALDRNAFTFTAYDLDVRMTPDSSGLDVRGKISLRNDSDQPQRAIALQVSSSLSWHSVRLADKPLVLTTTLYTSDIDHTGALSEATVTLPHDVPPKGTVELEVSYGGAVTQNATRLTRIGAPANIANTTEWDRVGPQFTAFRGFGYVTWYPVSTEAASLSEGNHVAVTIGTWEARHSATPLKAHLQCTCDLTMVASGHDVSPSPQQAQGGELTVEFPSLGSSVPVIAAGEYHKLNRPEAVAYFTPEDRAKAERFAVAAQEVTPFVTEWIATPHDPALLIDVPEAAAFDSGRTWIAPLGSVAPAGMPITATVLLSRAAIVSHRPWIADGLPQFMRIVYDESHGGRDVALGTMKNFRAPLADAEAQPDQNEPLARSTDPIFYRFKAMYVWWMLRDMLGDEVLQRAIHAYRAADDREPAYLQRLLRQFSTRDLEWFFDDWIYRDRGLPDFRVDAAFARPLLTDTGRTQGYTITVTVENLGNAGADVPVIVRMTDGERSQRVEVRARSKGVARIQVPSEPLEVIVNDGSVPENSISNNTFKMTK